MFIYLTPAMLIALATLAAAQQQQTPRSDPRNLPARASQRTRNSEPSQPGPPVLQQQGPPPAPTLTAQTLDYDQDTAPTIYTKIRYGSLIVLPGSEKIVEAMCGDKDQWQIAVSANIAYVKPEKARINTNLTLIGSSGLIYNFLLDEITDRPTLAPHVRTTVTARLPGPSALAAGSAGPPAMQFVSKAELNAMTQDYHEQLETALADARDARNAAKTTTEAAKATVENEVTRLRTTYPAALQFDYLIALNAAPFFVQAMFADDKFTYVRLNASEAPAIYELKDGKPNLVNFDYVNGVYIIRKVIEQGYLVIGKAKLNFTRKKAK